MIKVDLDDLKDLESDLKTFASRAYPFATKATINTAAFTAQKAAKVNIDKEMVLRSKYTLRTIQVEQARTLNVNRQESEIGSTEKYMETQEFGGTRNKKGKEGVPIPTSYAAGNAENAQPRTRMVKRPNKLKNIQLRNKVGQGNRAQALIIQVQNAVQSGNRYIFYDSGRSKGIFKVVGGSKASKSGWPKGAKLKMIYDLSRQSVNIPKNPWLKPAIDTTQLQMPEIYEKALVFQLKRQGLFKG